MIRRILVTAFARFSHGEKIEILLVALQLPLAVLALLLGSIAGTADFAVLYLAQLGFAVVLVAALETRRAWSVRRRLAAGSVATSPGDLLATPPGGRHADGLSGSPGSYAGLLEGLSSQFSSAHVTRFGLQTDAPIAYDVLAFKATGGRFDAASLVRAAEVLELGGPIADRMRATLSPVEFSPLVALARVMQAHAHPGTRAVTSAAFAFRRLPSRGSMRTFADDTVMLAQILLLERRTAEAARVFADIPLIEEPRTAWNRELLATDLVNPFIDDDDRGPVEGWTAVVNALYRRTGFERLSISAEEALEPFDRLSAETSGDGVADGPLVTVIMSTFRPGAGAFTAAASILGQTWRNLELLVMDDASGPEYDAVLERLAALDDRVRVHRAEANAGTYVRRNEALRLASGRYVTMQDSDDWSHPRRIELQAQHLETHPEVPANLVSALRVSRELLFAQPRGLHPRLCEPSLMFRREEVVERIGFFDSVRRSADSEYRIRIGRVFGTDLPILAPRAPLMLMRFDRESLSGSDLGDGWVHPARYAYRSAYLRWIARELEKGRTPHIPFPLEARPFASPPLMSGIDREPPTLRLLIAGDMRDRLPDGSAADVLAKAVRRAGSDIGAIGLLHVSSFRSAGPQLLDPVVQDLVLDGLVVQVTLGEAAQADVVLLVDPESALGLPRGEGGVGAGRVVALERDSAAGSGSRAYDVGSVDDACERHFGRRPEWMAPGRRGDLDLRALFDAADVR